MTRSTSRLQFATPVIPRRSMLLSLLTVTVQFTLSGCGAGQQVGGAPTSLGGDISQGYQSSLTSTRSGNGQSALSRGAYPMIETSFQLGSVPGDPFDYEKVKVEVYLKKSDGNNTLVPAFFDGGTTWRMRYTPTSPGQYDVVNIKLNGDIVHEGKLEKKKLAASAARRNPVSFGSTVATMRSLRWIMETSTIL